MFIRCKTDKGMVRNNNQDYVLNFRSSKYTLFIIADGMGGHNGGEIASKIAATSVRDFVYEKYINYNDKQDLLREAVVMANAAVFKEQAGADELKGMGTTITCCIIKDSELFYGHVGDSRAYIISGNGIRKITIDHSYVQELVKNGTITEEEAKNHPQRNLITRAVGTEEFVVVDTGTITLSLDDILLICSDGLTIYVSDEEICEIILNRKGEAAEELIELAKERGGSDNISVIIAGMEDEQ